MEIFCLNGRENDKIQMELVEVLGFPAQTSCEGGYDIVCRLLIQAGSCRVEFDSLYSATGALYRFSDELKCCYAALKGKAEYRLQLEDELSFTVEMSVCGKAVVTGRYQERPDRENILTFAIETDQSAFPAVIRGIDALKTVYGDMHGAANRRGGTPAAYAAEKR